MKRVLILAVVLLSVIWGLYSSLVATQAELADTQDELRVRVMIWWELRTLVSTYHQGILVSIPNYPGGGAPAGPMVLDTRGEKGRYEFAPDGKLARRIIRFADGSERVVETWPIPTDLTKQ